MFRGDTKAISILAPPSLEAAGAWLINAMRHMRSLFKEHSVELQYAMEAQASLITFRNDVVVKWRGVGLMCLSGDAHVQDGFLHLALITKSGHLYWHLNRHFESLLDPLSPGILQHVVFYLCSLISHILICKPVVPFCREKNWNVLIRRREKFHAHSRTDHRSEGMDQYQSVLIRTEGR